MTKDAMELMKISDPAGALKRDAIVVTAQAAAKLIQERNAAQSRILALEARADALEKALEEYGIHEDDCEKLTRIMAKCTCGLDAAIDGKAAPRARE